MANQNLFGVIPNEVADRVRSSLTYLILIGIVVSLVYGIISGGIHLAQLESRTIGIADLPSALILSLMRMSISYLACLVFAYTLGLTAALSRWGERVILPVLDVLQSVPVVGFFPAAVSFFIGVFQGHRIGIEMACAFLIFTSQAWNMAFAVYEAVKSIPRDSQEAVESFGLLASQRFWRLYAPASIPRLVYNSILSWSNGWYFLVACEIIAVGPIKYHLPGIGSFLALAAEQGDLRLILFGLVGLATLILLLDFLIWRPASIWALRFRSDQTSTEDSDVSISRVTALPSAFFSQLTWFQAPLERVLKIFAGPLIWILREVILPLIWDLPFAIAVAVWQVFRVRVLVSSRGRMVEIFRKFSNFFPIVSIGILTAVSLWLGYQGWSWFQSNRDQELLEFLKRIPGAVLVSSFRILAAMVLSLLWVLPVIYATWNRPKIRGMLITFAQVGASLPAVALFPLIVLLLVQKVGGGMELGSILLLVTGMQWYLLFNGLSGASNIPADIGDAVKSFGLPARVVLSKLVTPALRPTLLTGAITAWGGGWNALVVSEYVVAGGSVREVYGIGAILNRAVYQSGDIRQIIICVGALVCWVLLINTVVWKPLYRADLERYRFE